MTIAYVGNFSQRHCTEVHLALTLEKLGHEVIRIQEDKTGQGWLSTKIATADWDLFLFTRTWDTLVTLDHLAQLRERKIPSASYHLDLYVGLKREDGLDNDPFWRTDYVFTPDGSEMASKVFKEKGINHHYIKPAVFEDECNMVEGDIDPDTKRRIFPVIFVGGGSATGQGPQYGHSEWAYRGELIKFLQDTYGNQFAKFGHPQQTMRNEDLNHLYASADVVVGDSLCLNFDHPYYWSDRVYETLGRGGFIIHPYIKGMEEEFADGENIVFYEYNNWDQLKEKIDYYLSHNLEREDIREAGHEFVKKNATYTNRLQQALDIIFPKFIDGKPNGTHPDYMFEVGPTSEAGSGRQLSDDVDVETPPTPLKISLGAGTEPEEGDEWLNVDIVKLDGIDVEYDLMQYPWTFAQPDTVDYIKAKDIIEHMATHLPDGRNSIIAFIEECHKLLKVSGTLWIQTPSWDADFLWIDPTHVRGFDIRSFDFFDPDTDFGRSTGFYSEAKFHVKSNRLENGNLQFEMRKR